MCRGRVKNSGTREPRKEDPRLTQVAWICAELAGTEMNRLESHAAFMVRNKKFAYYLDNHHGDGMVAITCKVGPGDHELLAKSQPERYYLPAYLASRGWVALRFSDLVWAKKRRFRVRDKVGGFQSHDRKGVTLPLIKQVQ